MCGILFLASRSPLPDAEWTVDDPEKIFTNHIACDLEETLHISAADQEKTARVEESRALQKQLASIRNNVKISEQEKEQLCEALLPQNDNHITSDQILDTRETFISLINPIACRGPDYISYRTLHSELHYHLFSSVLSLRTFQSQPVCDEHYMVQFNGELYNPECLESNDTQFFIQSLHNKGVWGALQDLRGEFAFVVVDKRENAVYFGRDRVGKRALAFSANQDLMISSLAWPGSMDCANKIYKWDTKEVTEHEYETDDGKSNPDHHSLYRLLKKSTLVRQQTIVPLEGSDAHLGVLFSGGLDCTVIAALICENALETSKPINIDLLTVGFDNPRKGQSSSDSPDRQLARHSWKNLCEKYNKPGFLQVRLVEVDVPYDQWLAHKARVLRLIRPHNTEMDLSIAIAFYFASSRLPQLTSITRISGDTTHTERGYVSEAKVLFSGLGADELFAGYSRHESIFADIREDSPAATVKSCFEKLHKELTHDVDIIHERNLSRDDRVISCWGKEARYPYLDDTFITHSMRVSPDLKLAYSFQKVFSKRNKDGVVRIVFERKHVLRQIARDMGLEFVANEAKRAIQFGARSAKMEVGQSKVRGTDKIT